MLGVMNQQTLAEYLIDSGVRHNHSYGATSPSYKCV